MENFLINTLNKVGLEPTPLVMILTTLGFILVISIIVHVVIHSVIEKIVIAYYAKRKGIFGKMLLDYSLFSRLGFTAQGVLFYYLLTILRTDAIVYELFLLIANVWIMVYGLLSAFAALNTISDLLQNSKISSQLPVKGIFQSIKLICILVVTILIISLLIGRSPALLFSSLGAMTAVLMLIFKDPILGLVAGFQLTSNNMLKVGDWLEMPKYGADGDVTDISLTTVKVQNWDKTITAIPTYALISDSFKNWRGMQESGGRRIKRSIMLDQTSIHFLTQAELDHLKKVKLLKEYLAVKISEIEEYNKEHGGETVINMRLLTNVGTFRAYLNEYLKNHPRIHKNMTIIARQLAPTGDGLPIEIYAFTNTIAWAEYEGIQSDIFDHILSILPEFGLRVHQTPTGNDIREAVSHLK